MIVRTIRGVDVERDRKLAIALKTGAFGITNK